MPVETQRTRIEGLVISDRDNDLVEALSANEKATLIILGKKVFDRPLECSSVNHKNNYYKVLKYINKSNFTFTHVGNENNNGLIHKCNSKHNCVLFVNLKLSDCLSLQKCKLPS